MYVTEVEAKEKACCATSTRIDGGKIARGVCLGSRCMAWRWEKRIWIISKGHFVEPDEGFQSGDYEYRSTERGYCGLVGNA